MWAIRYYYWMADFGELVIVITCVVQYYVRVLGVDVFFFGKIIL